MPNFINYWNPVKVKDGCPNNENPNIWKNYYATVFKDSEENAVYCLDNFDRLKKETELFKNALFGSTLPKEAIDAISANISILKTPSTIRLPTVPFTPLKAAAAKAVAAREAVFMYGIMRMQCRFCFPSWKGQCGRLNF
jgi:hypothetical protein